MALRRVVQTTNVLPSAASRHATLGSQRQISLLSNLSVNSSQCAVTRSRQPDELSQQRRFFVSSAPTASSTASTASTSSLNPIDWWRGRQERNEANKYKERLHDMAQKERWTIGDMQAELQEVEKSWIAKIQDSAEIRQAKQMNATVKAIVSVVGADATDHDLASMTRLQKLQAAAQAGGVEQVNMLIQQFQTMGLMHRVLRQRQAQGKTIPTTAEAMQSVMQVEGPKLMSPAHKKNMVQLQQKRMKRALAKRR